MSLFITNSELLTPDIRAIITTNELVSISGQPLLHSSESKQTLLDDCEPVIDMPFMVREALLKYIPVVGHRHIRDAFLGEYAIILGTAQVTGDDYIFGVREALGFQVEPLELAEWRDSQNGSTNNGINLNGSVGS